MVKFFVVTGFALVLANGWIAWWLWRALDHTGWLRPALCLTVAVLGASFPLLYKLGGDSAIEVWLLRAGSFWLGMLFYVFCLVLLMDRVSPIGSITMELRNGEKSCWALHVFRD